MNYEIGDIIQFGRILTLHVSSSSSILDISTKACEAQLVEQSVEVALVVSSSLTAGRDFSIMVNAYDF